MSKKRLKKRRSDGREEKEEIQILNSVSVQAITHVHRIDPYVRANSSTYLLWNVDIHIDINKCSIITVQLIILQYCIAVCVCMCVCYSK